MNERIVLLLFFLLSPVVIGDNIMNETTNGNDTVPSSNQQFCGRQYCPPGQYCKYYWPHTYQCMTPAAMCDGVTMEFSLCACSYRCGADTSVPCEAKVCHPDCQCKSGYYVHTRIMDAMVCVPKDKCPPTASSQLNSNIITSN